MISKILQMIWRYLRVLGGKSRIIYKYIVVFITCGIVPIVALLISQVSRLVYKDKFKTVDNVYECGFSGECNNIDHSNRLNIIVPKFIVLEIILMFTIVSYYLFNNKIIVFMLLLILSGFSMYFSKLLKP